jgi:hypothetical protein
MDGSCLGPGSEERHGDESFRPLCFDRKKGLGDIERDGLDATAGFSFLYILLARTYSGWLLGVLFVCLV